MSESPGIAGAQLRHAVEIPLARVAAQHALEHARRSRLHRQMNVLADRVHLGDGRDDAIREVVRVRTGEANPANAVDGADRAKQVGEIELAVVIRVHRLAEQHDFRHALGDDRFHLAHDVRQADGSAPAPRVVGTMQYVHR